MVVNQNWPLCSQEPDENDVPPRLGFDFFKKSLFVGFNLHVNRDAEKSKNNYFKGNKK